MRGEGVRLNDVCVVSDRSHRRDWRLLRVLVLDPPYRNPLWIIPGLCALSLFAVALTRVDTNNAGRAYAAYGGIYILMSLLWLWAVEGVRPDRWDIIGAAICLAGAACILLAPRGVEVL